MSPISSIGVGRRPVRNSQMTTSPIPLFCCKRSENFACETKNFACELKYFACETKTFRRCACNSLKLLPCEIVDFAVSRNQEVGGRFLSRSFSLGRPSCRSIFGAARPEKHHDTYSDFLEESKSLIFSHG